MQVQVLPSQPAAPRQPPGRTSRRTAPRVAWGCLRRSAIRARGEKWPARRRAAHRQSLWAISSRVYAERLGCDPQPSVRTRSAPVASPAPPAAAHDHGERPPAPAGRPQHVAGRRDRLGLRAWVAQWHEDLPIVKCCGNHATTNPCATSRPRCSRAAPLRRAAAVPAFCQLHSSRRRMGNEKSRRASPTALHRRGRSKGPASP
jgi:hypothetical protein